MRIVFACLFCLSLAALPAQAGDLQAVRVPQGPRVDGRLDDAAWQAAAAFAAFRMADPVPGGEPSERTELRIVFDESNLYVGVLCLDNEPARIAAHSMAHDNSGGNSHGYGEGGDGGGESDDVVRVLLDPFRDRRTAYFFSVNPRGARSEGLAAGGEASLNWDGIWDAAARIDGRGWSAELRIPFKTLQFDPALAAWGINIERFIARRQETVRLSGVARDSNFYNPMDAAALSGVIGVRQGKGITIRPYGLARVLNGHDGGGADWELDGGLDVYKNFTPNLVGALSVNMDFAETEADERRINLTRFPLFFPEKRMFFLEGSETFGFSSSVSFQPFFSRKIGLYEGEQVPILFGGKLYGKVGRTNLAFLDVPGRVAAVLREFGPELRTPAGGIDRAKLGAVVFADPAARRRLEAWVHPPVIAQLRAWAAEIRRTGRRGVAVVPLLYETGLEKDWDAVGCVTASEPTVLARLAQ